MLKADNNTFHGRDVFAPVSAYLSMGVDIKEFGSSVESYKQLTIPKPKVSQNKIEGQILFFDKFGNGITNIKNIKKFKKGKVRDIPIKNIINAFLEGEKDNLYLIKGSFGFYEVVVPLDSAKDKFNLKVGDKVEIYEA
jgi:S-adenosylmethionine hydrolase